MKESRETWFWLRLMLAAEVSTVPEAEWLKQEAEELMRILGAIIVSAKGKSRR